VARALALIACAFFIMIAPSSAPAQMSDCTSEAAHIHRAEAELPRLEVAPPGDRQIVCITLETNLLFAKRLSAHLAKCPRSPLARRGNAWAKIGRDYRAQFNSRGCKQTIKGYRG
jgi:hypothetical protein